MVDGVLVTTTKTTFFLKLGLKCDLFWPILTLLTHAQKLWDTLFHVDDVCR